MLAAYRRRDWAAARSAAAACRPLEGSLAELYDVYDRRTTHYESAPPPVDWDGVFTAATKEG